MHVDDTSLSEELVDLVNENDQVIGRRTVKDCLREVLLHRAVVIFLRDTAGRVYLQKRSNSKRWYPGYWAASCAGHVSAGESYLQAARREVREELGLEAELILLGKFLAPKWKYGNEVEWEIDAVLEEKVSEGVRIIHNDEVADGKWIDYSELQKMVEKKVDLTPDTVMAFEEYYKNHG